MVQVLPWGLALTRGADLHITPSRVLGAILVVVAFLCIGGLVAVLLGDATRPRQAIAYGLGWQGLIGGFLQGRRAEQNSRP